MTTPVRRMLHEGRQFLALYRQRGCVPFRRKRKGQRTKSIEIAAAVAANRDALAPQAVDELSQVRAVDAKHLLQLRTAHAVLSSNAGALEVCSEFFFAHFSPFRAAVPKRV